MILTSVDLPAPFSPRSARIEPGLASRSTPCRTSTPPNDLRTSRALRKGEAWFSNCGARGLRTGVGVVRLDVLRGDHMGLEVHRSRLFLALDQAEQQGHDV